MAGCIHVMAIKRVTPSARGCEECLKIDSSWVHLRLCRSCGPDRNNPTSANQTRLQASLIGPKHCAISASIASRIRFPTGTGAQHLHFGTSMPSGGASTPS